MKNEFDDYINNYRKNNDNALWLSGESSEFFAWYKAKKLKESIELTSREPKILDFGCGDGLMTHCVKKFFAHAKLYGVDPSAKSIQEARNNFSDITFLTNSTNSTNLDFYDNTFDLIFSAGTFHHIPFEMHNDYLAELMRICKPSGYLVIFELNPLNPLTVLTFKRNPIDRDAKMLTPWYSYYLGKKYGKTAVHFICFFPKFLERLRWFERFLTKLPLGALYMISIQKDS